MTLEQRMSIISRKAESLKSAETGKIQELSKQIKDLGPRVRDLLTLARKCRSEGIEIPNGDGGSCVFFADRSRHNLGLPSDESYPCLLEIIAEGRTFFTDGDRCFSLAELEFPRRYMTTPSISEMQQFLDEFPKFEAAFYNWIDSMAEEQVENHPFSM